MLDLCKRLFQTTASSSHTETDRQQRPVVAVCALLIEIAKIDGEFSDVEVQNIMTYLKQHHDMSDAAAKEIVENAELQQDESMDLWKFTTLIDNSFTADEKQQVLELAWSVVLADGHIDDHEEHLTRRLADLIHVPHSVFIEAKMKALRARSATS